MKLSCLITSLALVTLFHARLSGDITNGNPFGPLDPRVTYEVLVDRHYYAQHYPRNPPDPIEESGNYEWNELGAFAESPNWIDDRRLNWDRTVVQITFDFGGISDFGHIGANLSAAIDWTSVDEFGSDTLYVHAYDIFDSTIIDLDQYLFGPPDSYQPYHDPDNPGAVTSLIGFQSKPLDESGGGGDRIVPIDIDLTDIFDVGTRKARIQVEYVDPDQDLHLRTAQLLPFTATWTPVPEPGCLLLVGLCAAAGLVVYRTKERPRRRAAASYVGEIAKRTFGLSVFLALVTLLQTPMHADITNGNPFGPINAAVITYERRIDRQYYTDNYGDPLTDPQGNYEWDFPGAFAKSPYEMDRNFNWDRTVVDITIDFGAVSDFNPNGANLSILMNWDGFDLSVAQDTIYVHAYDVLDPSLGVNLDNYLFNDPEVYFPYHSGAVTSLVGFRSAQFKDQGEGDIPIDIDLTDIFDMGTRKAKIQVEYVDPDLNENLNSASITHFIATWTPIPEPGCLTVLCLCAGGAALFLRRKRFSSTRVHSSRG